MNQIELLKAPDVVIPADAEVGEGPVFDPRTGKLVWVDITRGEMFQDDLESGLQVRTKLDTLIGAVAPRAAERGFAAAVSDGFGLIVDDALTVVDPVLPEPYRRMNDAKVDSRGRMWAGSTHLEFTPGVGALHRWDGRGPSTTVATGFILPNGLGWDADDSVMYLVDSFGYSLLAASYDTDDGAVGEFRQIATIDSGLPDGLAVDVDGFVWVAVWGGSEVRRYSRGGELVATVPMPVTQPSSCAFGADGTLYITSARAGLSEEDIAGQPLAGSVFALATSTRGVDVAPFAG